MATTRIKNKSAAPVQISAEALLREAVDRQEEGPKVVTTKFSDLEELHEWQGRQRSEFEKYVRQAGHNINNYLRYAAFEIEQREFQRGRSIFERALAAHPVNVVIWLRYIDSEIKNRNLNHARNLLDRAVTLLPRVDKLWFKYVYVEQTIGNVQGARAVFERWLQWEPDISAWSAAIRLETTFGEIDRARAIFERLVYVHGSVQTWLKFARFETEYGSTDLVREVYSQAVEALGEDFISEKIFMEWARFEAKLGEYERARAIYKFALDRMPRSKSVNLHKAYTQFEKQFGDSDGVEDVVLEKRRVQYEDEVRQNPKNYDSWIDLARLEETGGDVDRVRDAYERAIAQVPPSQEKRHWRRYLYIWLFYATWEELTTRDMERPDAIYQACLKLIPNSKWTSAKVWINYAMFRLRQHDLTGARKVLGTAIGKCPKRKLFKEYIAMEIKLFEFDRARQLYAKYIAWDPTNAEAWKSFAEMERGLADIDRARALYSLAISEEALDMPELLWKEYIDFETENEEYPKARNLYEELLQKTSHVKVWTSYAQFEASVPEDEEAEADDDEEDIILSDATKVRVRKVFERGYNAMKEQDLKEERVTLLNAWRAFENAHGSPEDIAKVQRQMPSKVKKRRKLDDDTYEEYMDWLFPADNESEKKLSNLLQMAQKWKQAQESGGTV